MGAILIQTTKRNVYLKLVQLVYWPPRFLLAIGPRPTFAPRCHLHSFHASRVALMWQVDPPSP